MAGKDAPNEGRSTSESKDIHSLVELRRHAQACHHRCLVAVLGCDAAERPRLCEQVMEMATGGLPTLVCSHKGGSLPKDAMVVEWPFADHDHSCLGGTFGACVFFDVPMASPETLWSACETVQGGGVVCLVLPPELTEKRCCALQEEAADIVPNADQKLGEALLPRIVQSLWQMPVCGFVDASLTLLSTKPIGVSGNLTPPSLEAQPSPEAQDALLQLCCTACQRKAFMRLQASLVALGQAKGRLFVAAALQCGRNVVVTGPARNSVQGIFRFAARAMGLPAPEASCSSLCHARARYLPAEGIPGFASALALVNDAPVLVVDEMASLPIPQLHQLLVAPAPLILQRTRLLGTLSGAEGTGAAVEEKVFKELSADSAEVCRHATLPDGVSEREFVKLCLQEAVRYKPGDAVEAWLDSLLFLDMPKPPADPKVYGNLRAARFLEIDPRGRDPLVSAVMGLLRGHYRTSPNDLTRLVTDSHIRTFALVANEGCGPPAVVVVAIEETPERLGKSGAQVHQTHLLANGVEKEYPFLALARLRGLRPWRVVAAPAVRGQGFGQRAAELLTAWAKGSRDDSVGSPRFDWLGVSFGLTAQLFRFWSRAGYRPVVMSNTPNDQTGEMSMKMLLPISAALERAVPSVLPLFGTSFFRRLPTCFRELDTQLVMDILLESRPAGDAWNPLALEAARLEKFATSRKPVEEAARIYDIFPRLASAYFCGGLGAVRLPRPEASTLCAMGGQLLTLEEAAARLGRGTAPGDRANDLAARLRSAVKEISLHIGSVEVECLLTVAPREQVLLERGQAHHVAQVWLPSLLELRGGSEVRMELPEPSEVEGTDPSLLELANYAIHDLHVQEPHFSLLMSGEKRIELRLAKRRFCFPLALSK
ncbi:N-acetyltransferase 10-like [Symbiodinium microadriaticum]|uniref:N-acetyltransferase 10-like n=1 Tax=Symbiodinium microadriaticum TaxID=2951 RepID=A0A1Q9DRF0_SYMMI|nr:N-acetyltransferase 10-like [Symbiodinium microadriaticum]